MEIAIDCTGLSDKEAFEKVTRLSAEEIRRHCEREDFTDRDVIRAAYSLIAALAEKLTGEVPVVRFENRRGRFTSKGPAD